MKLDREHWKSLLPFITAYANGEDVRYQGAKPNTVGLAFDRPLEDYSIHAPPKKVPMTADDFGPVTWVKDVFGVEKLITVRHPAGVFRFIKGGETESIEYAIANNWLWSSDRKTWHPFEKEVEA